MKNFEKRPQEEHISRGEVLARARIPLEQAVHKHDREAAELLGSQMSQMCLAAANLARQPGTLAQLYDEANLDVQRIAGNKYEPEVLLAMVAQIRAQREVGNTQH